MATDSTRSGHDAPGLSNGSEDAAVEALGRILSQSEAARGALESTLREGGTAVGTIAGMGRQDVGGEEERPGLAGYDDEGAVRVLISAMCWAGLDPEPAERVFQAAAVGPAGGGFVRCAGGAAGNAVAGAVPAGG